jgi:hypothetical protein
VTYALDAGNTGQVLVRTLPEQKARVSGATIAYVRSSEVNKRFHCRFDTSPDCTAAQRICRRRRLREYVKMSALLPPRRGSKLNQPKRQCLWEDPVCFKRIRQEAPRRPLRRLKCLLPRRALHERFKPVSAKQLLLCESSTAVHCAWSPRALVQEPNATRKIEAMEASSNSHVLLEHSFNG